MCCVPPVFCSLDRAAAALGTGHLPTRPTPGGPQCTAKLGGWQEQGASFPHGSRVPPRREPPQPSRQDRAAIGTCPAPT